ncbi:hypothetical protein SBADM41S_11552 [Streptomyces badius]
MPGAPWHQPYERSGSPQTRGQFLAVLLGVEDRAEDPQPEPVHVPVVELGPVAQQYGCDAHRPVCVTGVRGDPGVLQAVVVQRLGLPGGDRADRLGDDRALRRVGGARVRRARPTASAPAIPLRKSVPCRSRSPGQLPRQLARGARRPARPAARGPRRSAYAVPAIRVIPPTDTPCSASCPPRSCSSTGSSTLRAAAAKSARPVSRASAARTEGGAGAAAVQVVAEGAGAPLALRVGGDLRGDPGRRVAGLGARHPGREQPLPDRTASPTEPAPVHGDGGLSRRRARTRTRSPPGRWAVC